MKKTYHGTGKIAGGCEGEKKQAGE